MKTLFIDRDGLPVFSLNWFSSCLFATTDMLTDRWGFETPEKELERAVQAREETRSYENSTLTWCERLRLFFCDCLGGASCLYSRDLRSPGLLATGLAACLK